MKLAKPTLIALLAALVAGPALAEGDAEKGKKVYNKCKACHDIGEGAKNKVGPALTGIVGQEIASVEGFSYSDAFMAKKGEGLVWTEENLTTYLEKPKDMIPGTKMSFAGLKKEDERADVIAYIKSF
ncbi:cytochrome c family protein [Limibaculum sp. M0105]|uniref:Cytochrome c family protein n=1 Tax=Thermohalobaculum xanthum TaxID=2753746 RepID=A0A8J7M6L5_9RHOB|nr:cytochrome c family protein [Thermohalobaculum xanthum]MBK0399454.1 cytochrome c family protein [Thermohalobaculum xanthum]